MRRLTLSHLLELGASLGQAERALIRAVDRLRLVTHSQAAAVLGHDDSLSGARLSRKVLKRLTDADVLARLDRRVGGVRAGSVGYVYYLGPTGQRLVAYWDGQGLIKGRFRPEPGSRYVRHRLAVSDLYVRLLRASRDGVLDLLAFEAEPDCWRTFGDGFGGVRPLKPDGFVRIGLGAYEDRYFIEVDLATESRSIIAGKLRAYVAYFNSGAEQEAEGVFPRVLLLTTSDERKEALVDTCSRLPAESWRLFTVTTLDKAIGIFSGQSDETQAEQEAEALS